MDEAGSQFRIINAEEVATLAGGCFWCLQPAFEQLRGVEQVVVGYSGGALPSPSYQAVCTGATGHAEAVQMTFDPKVICFRDLLEVFFTVHDPTTLNRQGPDVGTQYRSAIFYHNQEQKEMAEQTISKLNMANIWDAPIVTDVIPFEAFYPAEEYHQNYFARNPGQGYCHAIIAPKVAKFREQFLRRLKV